MAQTLEQIEAELLQLPERARARLAQSLLSSLEDSDDTDADLLWAEEAERRYQEIRRGEVSTISSEDVFQEARSRLR
jgi:putative addiction module component (TIGR02574 family)